MALVVILVVILLAVIVLAASLLVVPFGISVQASRSEASTSGEISVHWLGIRLVRRRIPRTPGRPGRPGKAGKKRPKVNPLKILRLIAESYPSILIMLRGFRKSISFKRLSALVSFGLGDPAETAMISGYLWSLLWVINLEPRVSIVLKPDLERLELEGSVSAEAGLRLFPLVVAFLRAYRSRSFRELMREARKSG